jgi:hypothetical protein
MKERIKLAANQTRGEALEIGCNDQGSWGPPGQQGRTAAVGFYLCADGEFRAVLNNEHGSNQGGGRRGYEVHGGEVVRFSCRSLDAAIEEALTYCKGLGDGDLIRAHQIASCEARAWLRAHDIIAAPVAV